MPDVRQLVRKAVAGEQLRRRIRRNIDGVKIVS